ARRPRHWPTAPGSRWYRRRTGRTRGSARDWCRRSRWRPEPGRGRRRRARDDGYGALRAPVRCRSSRRDVRGGRGQDTARERLGPTARRERGPADGGPHQGARRRGRDEGERMLAQPSPDRLLRGKGTIHMNFAVGETVVYPHHGAALIEEVKTRTIKGEDRTYLKLRVAQGDLTIEVPADNVDLVG